MAKSLLDSNGEPCAASNATLSIIRGSGLRRYNGSITFVPAAGYESYGEPLDPENELVIDGVSKLEYEDELVRDSEHGYQGPKIDIKSLNWRKIDGPFVSIWLHNVPWGSDDTLAAPEAEFSDGCLEFGPDNDKGLS